MAKVGKKYAEAAKLSRAGTNLYDARRSSCVG